MAAVPPELREGMSKMANSSGSAKRSGGNFITRMGNACLRFSLKYMPDASIFAIILTVIAFLLGIVLADQTPIQMFQNWYKGFWELLAFAMQMAIIVVTGNAIANSPAVKGAIRKLASTAKTGKQAVWLVTFVSIIVSFVHWGLSLIVGALLAKELAKSLRIKNVPFEYGLIAAGGYVGQMTWHGMLSASIGLSIATPGHILESEMGIIPMSEYMINPMNIFVTIALAILPPLFASMMHPKPEDVTPLEPDAIRALELEDLPILKRPANPSVGDLLNYSPIVAWGIGLMGMFYVVYAFATQGFTAFDINMLNFIFLFVGILLYGNIANYVRAVGAAAAGTSGIIFQFPFYAGIMGMIKYSGLIGILAEGIVAISNSTTFYLWTFLSAALVNMFVPSGGGQWTVQGPIAVASAKMMNANMVKTCLMVAYGNTWTNMLQPFWAIALLGITGLKAKDLMGYSTAIMICSGFIFIIACFLPV